MEITGYWYEAGTSSRQSALMRIAGDSYSVEANGIALRHGHFADLSVSDRLGDTPRRIQWTDGALLETRDNALIDQWISTTGTGVKHKTSSLVHRLESNWGWVLASLLVTVLVAYAGLRFGLPAASERIARTLPQHVNEKVSESALSTLDRLMFEPSEISVDRKREVQQQFDQLLAVLPANDFRFTLHFRQMGGVANAMALPGGDVVVTDAFLELVEHPQELDSVLLHEIGHVVERHGMTQVIRASAVSVIASLAFGDLGAMGDLAVGVPIFIMQNSYSQSAETEADSYAFDRMRDMGKDPKYFADIILRLSGKQLEGSAAQSRRNYFASHPDSRERAQKALEASESHK
ncbi:MAG: M48 family metallopeptidase [Granulosicoccus sp.]